jgi:hypothetical protein
MTLMVNPASPHTTAIRTIHRDIACRDGILCRFVTLALDGSLRAHLSQPSQLDFWLNGGAVRSSHQTTNGGCEQARNGPN